MYVPTSLTPTAQISRVAVAVMVVLCIHLLIRTHVTYRSYVSRKAEVAEIAARTFVERYRIHYQAGRQTGRQTDKQAGRADCNRWRLTGKQVRTGLPHTNLNLEPRTVCWSPYISRLRQHQSAHLASDVVWTDRQTPVPVWSVPDV